MAGLRMLWLGRTLPVPLDAGDRIYSARLVEALAAAGAEIDYCGLANPDAPTLGADALDQRVDWRVVPGPPNARWRALASGEPLVGATFATAAYRATLEARLRDQHYDVIALDQYGLAWALPYVRQRFPLGTGPLLVHIAHDFETEVTAQIARDYRGNPLRRWLLERNARKAARAEARLAGTCDLIVTLTDHDAASFARLNPTLQTVVIAPGYRGARLDSRLLTEATPRRVALLGSYRWIAKQMNLSAFLDVADPIFAASRIELIVIGDTPAEFRARWEGRLHATRFLGFVDDLVDALADCRMGLVVEAIGGGFKLKVLDYIFLRLPVAALRDALGGQAESMTRHFLIEDDAEALAQRIVATIDRLDKLDAMQLGAEAAAEKLFSWSDHADRLLTEITGALQRRP